jgi:hemin uptake protein HemP
MQPEPPADDNSNFHEQTPPQANDPPRIIHAEDLFAGRREVWIQHGDQRYRLRITAAGKLILTK